MKNLLFLSLLFIQLTASGSHLMGGQITSRNLGGLTYQITLTAYRDISGIPIAPVDFLNINGISSGLSLTQAVTAIGPISLSNGVEKYVYIDTITLPFADSYSINFVNCCRNAAILNMLNPSGESMYLDNYLLADSTNSSPEFLNDPISTGMVGVPFHYNPLPYDADGDSLSWAIDIPLGDYGAVVAGYTPIPTDASMPFNLNSTTGEISFMPSMPGNYQLSIIANEYRNGTLIGYIRRDMQLIIAGPVNVPAAINSISSPLPYSNVIHVVPGQIATIDLDAIDPDSGQIDISFNGEPFLSTINYPVTTTIRHSSSHQAAHFTWTPDPSRARYNPYVFSARISKTVGNLTLIRDVTYQVKVEMITGPVGIDPSKPLSIYPNPSSGRFSIRLGYATNQPVHCEIADLSGRILKSGEFEINDPGNGIVVMDHLELPKGYYSVKVIDGVSTFLGKVLITGE